MSKDQLELIEETEWVGMPEFEMQKVRPFSAITIRFETAEDLAAFADLIGQRLTDKTKSIWHPHKPHALPDKKMYFDES